MKQSHSNFFKTGACLSRLNVFQLENIYLRSNNKFVECGEREDSHTHTQT